MTTPLRLRRNNLWLCLSLAVAGLGDGILTLVGNNRWGWEMTPVWVWFFQHGGSLSFVAAFLGYLAVFGMLVAVAPLRLAKGLCVMMVLAHTSGIASWLRLFPIPYLLEPLVYVAMAALTVFAFEKSSRQ